jgi:hypothetical protein
VLPENFTTPYGQILSDFGLLFFPESEMNVGPTDNSITTMVALVRVSQSYLPTLISVLLNAVIGSDSFPFLVTGQKTCLFLYHATNPFAAFQSLSELPFLLCYYLLIECRDF